jgi:hypothetical protein
LATSARREEGKANEQRGGGRALCQVWFLQPTNNCLNKSRQPRHTIHSTPSHHNQTAIMSEAENKPKDVSADAPKTEETKTVTEQATETAAAAASAVKDNVFSMFGGGPKKEKADEQDDAANDRSGSSKATAAKATEEVTPPAPPGEHYTNADTNTAGGRG